jgi:1,4-dihydroxy-2-naphthoyl-CoA synthase
MLGDGIAHEMLTFMTADHREGANAFLEKRPARFEGR